MLRHLFALAAFAAASIACVANADTIEQRRTPQTAISTLTTASFNSGVWSGWIPMLVQTAICFEVFHDYTAATGVTMTCEVSDSKSTTADSGFEITSQDIANGTATSEKLTWSHATGADARFSICVDYVPDQYINCKFDDLAAGAAGDKITVTYALVTP